MIFKPNEKFPQLCEAVTVCYDTKRGRYVKALRDIPVGEIVCEEIGIVSNIHDDYCEYCLKACTDETLFCDPPCVPSRNLRLRVMGKFEEELKRFGLARHVMHVILAHNPAEIAYWLDMGIGNQSELRKADSLSTSQFASILALESCAKPENYVSCLPQELVNEVLQILKSESPEWSVLPNIKQIFLKAFDVVFDKLVKNAHTVYTVEQIERQGQELPVGTGVFPIASIFNHSCKANVFSFFDRNRFVFISKGVNAGEELVDNYGVQLNKNTLKERKEFASSRGYTCFCEYCERGEEMDRWLDVDNLNIKEGQSPHEMLTSAPRGHKEIENLVLDLLDARRDLAENLPEAISHVNIAICNMRVRGISFDPQQVPLYLRLVQLYEMRGILDAPAIQALYAAYLRVRTFYDGAHPKSQYLQDMIDNVLKPRKRQK